MTVDSMWRQLYRYVAEKLGHEKFTLVSTGDGHRVILDSGARSDELSDLDKAIAQVMSAPAPAVSAPDDLLKLREVEAELNVSRVTLLRWIRDGKLTAVRVGQQWRVRRSGVEAMKGERA
jgi:excisionase family DNA binding protein